MNLGFSKWLLAAGCAGILILSSVTLSRSEVAVFDEVTTVQTPVRIKVLTKGRIFSQGGRLVDIYQDDNHLKQILTGGDGYGYLKYIPQNSGLKEIIAQSGAYRASGLILVMGKNEKAIVIDVEGAFKNAIFSESLRENSRKVVKALSQDYQVIYLSRYVGQGISRSWLEKEDFPKSVILRWNGPDTFKTIEKRGVHLVAVIGSAAVVSAAKDHIENRYTFDKGQDGQMVKTWDEILRLLPSADPMVSPEKDPN